MNTINKIVIMPNSMRDVDYVLTSRVCEIFISHGASVYISDLHRGAGLSAVEYYDKASFPRDAQLITVIGGDGSVLDASKYAIREDIPILAINKGHLGYLTQLDEDNLEPIEKIFSGEYKIADRMLIAAELPGNADKEMPLAMNDFVLTHHEKGRMIEYEISEGGHSSLEYSSDSLVIATPSGSTGYSMSGGGPVLDTDIKAICVTPIAPHSFFGRSMIFGADTVIEVKNTSDRGVNIALMADGRSVCDIEPQQTIRIRTADRSVKFITFGGNATIDKLCLKMKMSNAKYN